MRFYLGTHRTPWLRKLSVPLMLNRRVLLKQKSWPEATAPWALDSGAFTELTKHGRWTVQPSDYVREVRELADAIGQLALVLPLDWLCTEGALKATGLTVGDHQRLSVESYLELRDLAPELPWVPVLQGDTTASYWHCAQLYREYGVDLHWVGTVAVGSIAARQRQGEIARLLRELHEYGLRLHGLGVGLGGLEVLSPYLVSADSAAWSKSAWRERPPGITRNCAHCKEYALYWRGKCLTAIDRARRGSRS